MTEEEIITIREKVQKESSQALEEMINFMHDAMQVVYGEKKEKVKVIISIRAADRSVMHEAEIGIDNPFIPLKLN